MRARGRGGSASEPCDGGGGKHGCMACVQGVWGSAAHHVCAAASPGAVGVERWRTRRLNWMMMMRAMYCRGHVDLGGEDVCSRSHKPDEKRTEAKKETSLAPCLISVRPPSTPKSADLTKEGRAREQNITSFGDCAGSLVGMCAWVGRRWHHQFKTKCDAGSPRLPQHKEAVGRQRWESAKAHVCAVRGHVGHAP